MAKTTRAMLRPTTPLRFCSVSRTPSSVDSAATTAWVPRRRPHAGLRHGRRTREADAEGRAIAWRAVDLRPPSVRRGNPGDDRQPEARAAGDTFLTPCPRGVHAVEALEDVLRLVRTEARSLVRDLEDRPLAITVALGAQTYRHRRRRRGVLQCVGDEVAEHLPQSHLVADDDSRRLRPGIQQDLPIGRDDARILYGVLRQVEQVYRVPLEWSLLVESGQQQQIVDQHAHPLCLGLDPAESPLEVRLVAERSLPEQLGEPA